MRRKCIYLRLASVYLRLASVYVRLSSVYLRLASVYLRVRWCIFMHSQVYIYAFVSVYLRQKCKNTPEA